MKKVSLAFLFIVLVKFVFSQLQHGGTPLSFRDSLSLTNVPFIELPYVPNIDLYDSIYLPPVEWEITGDTVLGYDSVKYEKGKPTFCIRTVNESLLTGLKTILSDSMIVIRLGLISKGADNIVINFEQFHLDSNEAIYVYSIDQQRIVGAYNSLSNTINEFFSSAPVFDDTIIIEYNRFSSLQNDSLNILIKSINHEVPVSARSSDIGNCYINVNCNPFNYLCNSIRSTVRLSIVDNRDRTKSYSCSGVLVTNADVNFETYIITAKHCLTEKGDIIIDMDNTFAVFNDQAPNCNDGNEAGPGNMRITGVSDYWLSDVGLSNDLAILKFRDKVPIQYNSYYSGWNRETIRNDLPSTDVRLIHHPSGVNKKVSDGSVKPSFLLKKWFVYWDQSSTEGGSSGAPLFDSDSRLIGSLSGGLASCNNILKDYCGKIGKFDDFRDVIATDNSNITIFAMGGVDPLLICQEEIKINGDVEDASLWRASNSGNILIQADNHIILNSAYSENPFTQTRFLTGSNYTLQAGQSIKFLPGTRVLRTVESFVAKVSECNAINNPCYNYVANKMDENYYNTLLSKTMTSFNSEKNSLFKSHVYPNPTSGNITITISDFTNSESSVLIFSIIGEQVFDQHFVSDMIDNEEFEINSLNLADGIYFAKITNGKDSEIHRFIVSKN